MMSRHLLEQLIMKLEGEHSQPYPLTNTRLAAMIRKILAEEAQNEKDLDAMETEFFRDISNSQEG